MDPSQVPTNQSTVPSLPQRHLQTGPGTKRIQQATFPWGKRGSEVPSTSPLKTQNPHHILQSPQLWQLWTPAISANIDFGWWVFIETIPLGPRQGQNHHTPTQPVPSHQHTGEDSTLQKPVWRLEEVTVPLNAQASTHFLFVTNKNHKTWKIKETWYYQRT